MARYEIQVVNGQPVCWDTELNIGVGNVDTCRRIQSQSRGRVGKTTSSSFGSYRNAVDDTYYQFKCVGDRPVCHRGIEQQDGSIDWNIVSGGNINCDRLKQEAGLPNCGSRSRTREGKMLKVNRDIPMKITAESRFVGFMGSNNATMQSNLIYLGTSALGAYAGMKFLKLTSDKANNTLIGLGLGLAAGALINKYVK